MDGCGRGRAAVPLAWRRRGSAGGLAAPLGKPLPGPGWRLDDGFAGKDVLIVCEVLL